MLCMNLEVSVNFEMVQLFVVVKVEFRYRSLIRSCGAVIRILQLSAWLVRQVRVAGQGFGLGMELRDAYCASQ